MTDHDKSQPLSLLSDKVSDSPLSCFGTFQLSVKMSKTSITPSSFSLQLLPYFREKQLSLSALSPHTEQLRTSHQDTETVTILTTVQQLLFFQQARVRAVWFAAEAFQHRSSAMIIRSSHL